MSGAATPDSTAELRKLAHTLGVDVGRLGMVSALPSDDLRALRKQVGEALFQADRPAFARVAALSKAVPGALAAKLTQATLPPLLAARTAELLEPARAVDMVGRLSDTYLADVSAAMDASRAPEVIAAIPAERAVKVALELARRQEWVVIGGFVAQVSMAALRASVAAFDGGQLLRIGFVLDDLSRLDDIGVMLTDTQIDQLLNAAAAAGLWTELAELLEHLQPERVARLADRFAAAGEPIRTAFRTAVDEGLFPAASLRSLARD
ncbi:MAG: hypothetical protein ACR2LX_05040 [Jatrophihabitans sp.]